MAFANNNQTSGLYNLRWNSYSSNLVNVFTDHQKNEALVDVTISCEAKFLKAHKLILSASSVYFQKIFEIHKEPNMLIILNEAKFADLKLLMQFIYSGEVKVAQDQLHSFLALGRLLQVKGLSSVQLNYTNKKNPTESTKTDVSKTNTGQEKKQQPKEIVKINAIEDLPLPKLTLIGNKRKHDSSTNTPPVTPSPPPAKTKALMVKPAPVEPTSKHFSANDRSASKNPRPPNAFMIFANQWRKKLAVEHPNDTNKEISVKLSTMWKSLSQDTKDQFYEDAKRIAEGHDKPWRITPGTDSPNEIANNKVQIKVETIDIEESDVPYD